MKFVSADAEAKSKLEPWATLWRLRVELDMHMADADRHLHEYSNIDELTEEELKDAVFALRNDLIAILDNLR